MPSRVELLTDRNVGLVVAAKPPLALVAGPAEIAPIGADHVELIRPGRADLADPELRRARPECEAERVPQPVRDELPPAARRVDANDRATDAERVAPGRRVLGPQRPALAGWICADVPRFSRVHAVVARALASARVEEAVRAEREVTDAVARILLAPTREEHALPPPGLEPREPAAHRACAFEQPLAGCAAERLATPDRPVEGVEHVEERAGRKARVEGESEEPAVAVREDASAEVRVDARPRAREARELQHPAALLRNEDAAVAGECDRERLSEVAQDDLVDESGGRCRRLVTAERERRRHRCGEHGRGERASDPARHRAEGSQPSRQGRR